MNRGEQWLYLLCWTVRWLYLLCLTVRWLYLLCWTVRWSIKTFLCKFAQWLHSDCKWLYSDCKWLHSECKWLYSDCKWLYSDCKWLHSDCKWLYSDCTVTVSDCTAAQQTHVWLYTPWPIGKRGRDIPSTWPTWKLIDIRLTYWTLPLWRLQGVLWGWDTYE